MKNKIDKIRKVTKITYMFSFPILVIIFLIYGSSKNFPGILVLLTGSLLNLACVITNNWKMPTYYGKKDYIHTIYKNRKNIKLWFLSDFIHLFIPTFKNKKMINIVFSLGDILIAIGISNIFLGIF